MTRLCLHRFVPAESEFLGDLQPGLSLLLRAWQLARDAGRDVWDFAVEIEQLRLAGFSLCDLRWLACMGYIEHGREQTRLGQHQRLFDIKGGLLFSERTCVVLTAKGVELAKDIALHSVSEPSHSGSATYPNSAVANGAHPTWDAKHRELWVGRDLVKAFRVPAANQELILSAFEEEDWPPSVDDPLPPAAELNAKRRLHAAIQGLNRNQRVRRIRFRGNGLATGILWNLVGRP